MQLTEIDVESIVEPIWNSNQMDQKTKNRLRASVQKYELVEPLVVREISPLNFETIGGAQRLSVIKELGLKTVPCVVVTASNAEARLLAQALNSIEGTDDPAKRQVSLDLILENIPTHEVLQLLPDAEHSIGHAISFGLPSLLDHLSKYEKSRKARLNHFAAQFTSDQMELVGYAVAHAKEHGPVDEANPNKRGNALFHICQNYLAGVGLL